MAFFWKRRQKKEMDIPPPPPKPKISIPSDLPSFPSSMEEKLPPLPPLEKKPEPPIFKEEAERLPPMPKFEPLPPLPPLEPEEEIKRAVNEVPRPAPKPYVLREPVPRPHLFRPPEIPREAPRPIPEMPRPVIRQAAERIFPKREKLEISEERQRVKRGLLRGRELFIEVEDYRIIFEILTSSRKNVSELSESIEKVEGFVEEEEAVFEKWQGGLEIAQKKLIFVDKSLFK